jgi:hypothetical protein
MADDSQHPVSTTCCYNIVVHFAEDRPSSRDLWRFERWASACAIDPFKK